MSEMKKYRLGDVAEVVSGATPSTKDDENWDGDIIWCTPKDLSDQKSKYFHKGAKNISQND